jgi:hypothetical protein
MGHADGSLERMGEWGRVADSLILLPALALLLAGVVDFGQAYRVQRRIEAAAATVDPQGAATNQFLADLSGTESVEAGWRLAWRDGALNLAYDYRFLLLSRLPETALADSVELHARLGVGPNRGSHEEVDGL